MNCCHRPCRQAISSAHPVHALRCHRAVSDVTGRQNDHPWTAELVGKRMSFAVPATPRDADRLFGGPPFPPRAQRCALTWVLSSATCSGGSGSPATFSNICCQIPRPLHRLKRLYTVVYGPYSGGQSCQRHPVFNTWMIPLRIRRLFCGFGPGLFIGRRGSIFAHCRSFNQNRFALICWPPIR